MKKLGLLFTLLVSGSLFLTGCDNKKPTTPPAGDSKPAEGGEKPAEGANK